MIMPIKTASGGYDVTISRGALFRASEIFNLNRRVLVVTDSGVPSQYAECVASQCKTPTVAVIEQGEASKNIDTFKLLLTYLVENNFTRSDCVVAVGGGVVGDLAGFVASAFMRGIDFYNIPTTFLSQVDSSIGGKTAIDFMGLKNIVGAFYPPKGVLIDSDTLKTLPPRQLSNGMAESVKMSLTSDPVLFEIFESGKALDNIDTVIERSLAVKKDVVERDEHEGGLRRILNFGHTIAHAIESVNEMERYYHGECVAIGMVPMCSDEVAQRLIPVLESLNLPTVCDADAEDLLEACRHDKKMSGDTVNAVFVPKVGEFEIKKLPFSEFENIVRGAVKK